VTHTYQVHKKYDGIPESKQYGAGVKIVNLTGEGVADADVEAITPAITLDFQLSVNGQPRSVITNAEADCVSVPAGGEVAMTVIPKVNAELVAKRGALPVQYVVMEVCSNENPEQPFFQRTMTPDSSALSDFLRTVKDEDGKCDSLVVSVGKPVVVKLTQQRDTTGGFIDYTFKVRGHLADPRIRAEGLGSHKTFHLVSLSNNTRSRSDFDLSELLYPYSAAMEHARTRSADSCPAQAIPQEKLFDGFIASEDGGLLYEFKNSLHIRTLDSLTGQAIYTFKYNPQGYLMEVQDIDGDVTRIERDGNNQAVAIIAPYGQRTVLTLDNQGYLAAMTNEAGETHAMVYTVDGLMTQYADPRGNVATYEYDKLGLFVKETNAIGGGYSVGRVDQGGGYVATLTSKEGRVSSFQVNGGVRTNVAPDGTATIVQSKEGERSVTSADGTVIWTKEELDTRLASFMASPVPTTTSIKTPNGLTAQITTETVTDPPAYDDNYKPWNLWTLTNKVTVNGRTSSSVFDKTANTITATSAAGRKSMSFLDGKGRVVKEQAPGFVDTSYTYDTRGRLTQVSEGEGVDLRTASLEYDARGNINKVTDALGRQVSFDYDLVGRVTKQTLTDGRQIIYSYDANGNVTTITPPSRPAHGFAYNGEDLQTQYTPPPAGLATPQTQYVYNLDKELTKVVRPDGQSVDFEYDKTKGRLNALNTPNGKYGYAYDDKSGNLTTVTAPDGNSLSYQYDGSLPLSVTWGGAIQGNLSVTYDNDFRVTATSINGGSTVNYDYDADSLLVKAGDLWLVRDPENGLLKGTQLGGKDGIVTQRAYNAFGEMVSETATVNGNPLYTNQYSYDKLGRITQKVETLEGVVTTLAYDYDPAGRLVKVTQNGAVTEQYSYDGNGNRLSAITATHGSVTGSYDEQDRLLQYADNTYSYTANGELLSKTSNGATTQYQYDVLGNLRSVKLPDGKQLEYVIDASGRRVGKKVNGVLTQGWLYQGSLNPIAELDGTGQVVTRFVYGSKANVPDYLVKGDKTYRIISDHLGSPRLVVDLSTGTVVQRMEYDAFGNVTQDSNPGFQPFGFAGGLYDSETQLVRFGARDYDAETGRWTAKDPILFDGGDSNLYGYVINDPVNLTDVRGLFLDTILDVGFILYDLYRLVKDNVINGCPNLGENLTALAGDVGGFLIPFASGGGLAARGVMKAGKYIDKIKDTAKFGEKTKDFAKAAKNIPPCSSFPAETLVHTEDGLKPISEIKVGDKVLSFDEATQSSNYQLVTALIQHLQQFPLVKITTELGEVLEVTPEHPLYVEGKGWLRADNIKTGESLRLKDGHTTEVKEIGASVRAENVYNLTVANTHSYFVGAEGVLAHNMCDWRRIEALQPMTKSHNNPLKTTQQYVDEAQDAQRRMNQGGSVPQPPGPTGNSLPSSGTDMFILSAPPSKI
jgi:RHS repeat-associated protein